jgi:hypothetical protein
VSATRDGDPVLREFIRDVVMHRGPLIVSPKFSWLRPLFVREHAHTLH